MSLCFLRRASAFACLAFSCAAPSLDARSFSLVAYNVENLHDVDGVAVYEDYQPGAWTNEHLRVKLANTVAVLARVDKGVGPDVIALNEIELDQTPGSTLPGGDYAAWLASVAYTSAAALLAKDPLPPELAGLPAEAWLLKACADAGLTGYHVAVTDESPSKHEDGRGVAVRNVLFSRFPVTAVKTHPLASARGILEATLDVEGRPFTVLVNHWKSGAGDAATEEARRENAKVLRGRLDKIFKGDPNADVVVAGDLNSHYNQKQRYREVRTTGINDVLGSQGNELALRGEDRDLYNLWFELPSDQRGSDTYRGEWGTLMHLIVSRGLYDQNGVQYEDGSFAVLKFAGLNANGLGLPNRWSRGKVPGGFSDHFPIVARFRTVATRDKDKWMPLLRPSETDAGPASTLQVDTSPVDLFANAVKYAELPEIVDIRDGTYTGRIFFVEAPCYVNDKGHVKVRLGGLEYDVYSHQKGVRDEMRERARAGTLHRFYGELGQYRGAWQFVLHGKEWVR
jgi:hypothetical protein